MLLKYCRQVLCKPYIGKILPSRYSALFINGQKATENYVFLLPHIDILDRMKDKDSLSNMLSRRKSCFELTNMENLWQVYKELNNHKIDHDNQKNELGKKLNEALKVETEGNKVEQIKIQINLIKDNLKNLKVPLWCAEEAAITEALKLPNVLHTLTPDVENKIIYEHNKIPDNTKNHRIIGETHNLIKFMRNNSYYLLGDAALFELGAEFFFSQNFKKNNFIQFSCPDFVKSLIVEGCGIKHTDPTQTFILHDHEGDEVNQDRRLHLTGAGSICSFFAYHAKHVIYSKVLPLKYFCMGRLYEPSTSIEPSLFNAYQSTVFQMFVATKDDKDLDEQLHKNIELIKEIYSSLNYNFRLSYVSADKLQDWESLRVAIEMYSSSLKQYVEIGHLSASNDYISKRLMFTYTENKEHKFPHIISGTVLNVPKFIACVLEQDEDFVVPDAFQVNHWKQKTHVDTL